MRRFVAVDSTNHVPPLPTVPTLTRPELEALLVETYGKAATLEQTVSELREEIARLKGLKGRPNIKPNGMDKGTAPANPAKIRNGVPGARSPHGSKSKTK